MIWLTDYWSSSSFVLCCLHLYYHQLYFVNKYFCIFPWFLKAVTETNYGGFKWVSQFFKTRVFRATNCVQSACRWGGWWWNSETIFGYLEVLRNCWWIVLWVKHIVRRITKMTINRNKDNAAHSNCCCSFGNDTFVAASTNQLLVDYWVRILKFFEKCKNLMHFGFTILKMCLWQKLSLNLSVTIFFCLKHELGYHPKKLLSILNFIKIGVVPGF